MGIYSLTAKILDRAEAAESLRATTVWNHGLPNRSISLSADGPVRFAQGAALEQDALCVGQRGNYFVGASIMLPPEQARTWYLVADVDQSHVQVARTCKLLLDDMSIGEDLERSILAGHKNLLQNVASSDGLQATGRMRDSTHHFANVMFNNMRGGVPASSYCVETRDFLDFLYVRNRQVAADEHTFLAALPERITYVDLLIYVRGQNNIDLVRLAYEYLPLTFGRRHGDPSRPWNAFEIKVQHEDGSKIYNYQGNWRDIFQNWEALCASFPVYLPGIVAKFVNASTVDGFNPYRLTRDGIDWEIPEPEAPWSNIGYWGDHQIIYLTKLLEAMKDYFPGELEKFFDEQIFCYANVPYRIKPFKDIVANSHGTIDYDLVAAKEIERRVGPLGMDGRLVLDEHDRVCHVNLIEKLLVPVLSKLSNFVVDGGIWLNTQRPEWNDANNAIVGSGLSMVTVCYLRRHLSMLTDALVKTGERQFAVSVEVMQWFHKIRKVLHENSFLLLHPTVNDEQRGRMLHKLGNAFSDYRSKVYEEGFSVKHSIHSAELVEFCQLAVDYIDHSIRANRREDGLYHAYNLLEFGRDGESARISHLYEMLEGQVAVLCSGALHIGEAAELVDALFDSKLYRPDQRSFMLNPDRKLPGFLDRNQIDAEKLNSVGLLRKLVEANDWSIVVSDVFDDFHFHHSIARRADLEAALYGLEQEERWAEFVVRDRDRVLNVFEDVFKHKTYTGRSGTMYGYEGLGCIYWHMVSKLLLAIQENVFRARDQQASKPTDEALADAYYLVRGGLSSDKTPFEYGAFPTDPYSHTPKHGGARQPGMTGQVKEEILTRRGELGIRIIDGRIHFHPLLLRRIEFCKSPRAFTYFDLSGNESTIELLPDSLAFTICQVPVIYQLSDTRISIELTDANGQTRRIEQDNLDPETSLAIFQRTGKIMKIEVRIPEDQLLQD